MEKLSMYVTGQNTTKLLRFIIAFLLSSITAKMNLGFPSRQLNPSDHMNLLQGLVVEGHFSFHDLHEAAKDFGNQYHSLPFAILHPKSVSDIAKTVKLVYENGYTSKLTVAARGHAHSLHGQAQALDGLVINMESLKEHKMHVEQGEFPFVDVPGGELWINVLHETLKYGLAPKSWTDYLHLTVGGTLSNAGISGQAFKHGPQISNVLQFEVVTGKGEVMNCSSKSNADLFQAVLGGLGQFGIITRARIALEQAPNRVRWIRVLYSDFSSFVKDQEMLIAAEETFDYIEGFVIINKTGLLNNWRSSFNPQDPVQAGQFSSDGRTLFCLEVAKYFNSGEGDTIEQEVNNLLAKLSYIPSTLFESEASYLEFLDRVHISEMKLRSQGLWEVPHPWLNLLVPRSKIQEFAENVFGRILKDNTNGPILMYPLNKSRWDGETSAITPQEEIFYLVGFLSSAMPTTSGGSNSLEHILAQNRKVLDFCELSRMGVKQYLPHYTTNEDWQAHFGDHWENLVRRKSAYDPLAILAPGQRIFKRINPSMEHDLVMLSQ